MDQRAERLARGEHSAFAELYDACADWVHHYLVVRLGSTADAGDVLQETLVCLARTRKRLATIAAEIASITDPATGQWAYQRLAVSRPPDDDAHQYAVRLQQMIQQRTVDIGDRS